MNFRYNSDILDVHTGIIVQQVNCQGVMGAGLAKQIADKYPQVYNQYRTACKNHKPDELLGNCLLVGIDDSLVIANVFGQMGYGRDKRHTNYQALASGLYAITNVYVDGHLPEIHIPYGVGCGLGGGNWDRVLGIIEGVFIKEISRVTIHNLKWKTE